jgi:signal transduction histidine kinase
MAIASSPLNTFRTHTQMKRISLVAAALVAGLATTAFAAAEFGTAAEAKAMLDKVATAVKADKAKALASFSAGEGGFKDRDLYPFCAGADGNFTAHPTLVGKSLKELKDKTGKAMGAEMLTVAAEGKVAEVSYMWPRPGNTEPVQKVSYVTKVGDQVCAVGYYK